MVPRAPAPRTRRSPSRRSSRDARRTRRIPGGARPPLRYRGGLAVPYRARSDEPGVGDRAPDRAGAQREHARAGRRRGTHGRAALLGLGPDARSPLPARVPALAAGTREGRALPSGRENEAAVAVEREALEPEAAGEQLRHG